MSCQYCSDGCESWMLTADLERRTNATEECLACHTDIESIKQTNMFGNRSVSSPDVRSLHCQSSSIASCHGSAMFVVMNHCRTVGGSCRRGRPRKSWKDSIKEWSGQSMSLLQRITDDGSQWAVIAANASASQVFVNLLVTPRSRCPQTFFYKDWT